MTLQVATYMYKSVQHHTMFNAFQIYQTSHDFPFGSAIVNYVIAGESDYDRKYQDCFYAHFNWAVSEGAMKWHVMEEEQVSVDADAMTALIFCLYEQLQKHTAVSNNEVTCLKATSICFSMKLLFLMRR